MQFARILLFPFSILYGILVYVYHQLYNWRLLPSSKFNIPVISVGNITVGGTGKTPHVEYIVRLLLQSEYQNIATLSRGYGRATSGFILLDESNTASEVGDEPRQLMHKFKNIHVAVDENRANGIRNLMKQFDDLNAVLLDDAFQHRQVRAGLSILLMDYHTLSKPQMMLPAGNMREPQFGAKRADIIVITNSPKMLSPLERRRIESQIKPTANQKMYFSYVSYGDLVPAFEPTSPMMVNKEFYFERDYSILLLTGIADPYPLEEYYSQNIKELKHIRFADHHEYTMADIERVMKKFDNIVNENKIILTTEKDAMRLAIPGVHKALEKNPIFYIPITIVFHDDDGSKFNKQMLDYVAQNQRYNRVHPGQS